MVRIFKIGIIYIKIIKNIKNNSKSYYLLINRKIFIYDFNVYEK